VAVLLVAVLKWLLLDLDTLILLQSDDSKKTPADRTNASIDRGLATSSFPKETSDKVIMETQCENIRHTNASGRKLIAEIYAPAERLFFGDELFEAIASAEWVDSSLSYGREIRFKDSKYEDMQIPFKEKDFEDLYAAVKVKYNISEPLTMKRVIGLVPKHACFSRYAQVVGRCQARDCWACSERSMRSSNPVHYDLENGAMLFPRPMDPTADGVAKYPPSHETVAKFVDGGYKTDGITEEYEPELIIEMGLLKFPHLSPTELANLLKSLIPGYRVNELEYHINDIAATLDAKKQAFYCHNCKKPTRHDKLSLCLSHRTNLCDDCWKSKHPDGATAEHLKHEFVPMFVDMTISDVKASTVPSLKDLAEFLSNGVPENLTTKKSVVEWVEKNFELRKVRVKENPNAEPLIPIPNVNMNSQPRQ
jgi:hypothetical protein